MPSAAVDVSSTAVPDQRVARRGELAPATLSPEKVEEYLRLSHNEQAYVTAESIAKWTGELHPDDWTVSDVVRLESRRQLALKTLRVGAELEPLEFKFIRFLQRNEGRTCTYIEIVRHLWSTPQNRITAYELRAVDGLASPYVKHVWLLVTLCRRKLEIDPARPQHIALIRGVGYRWYTHPPALDDGEDYEKRNRETDLQRAQLRHELGYDVEQPSFGVDQRGEHFRSRIQPGPALPRRSTPPS